jgi:hypothetical protein
MADHTVHLRVGGRIQALKYENVCKSRRAQRFNSLVVVDVELRIWVRSTSCFESDPHKVLTNDVVENAVPQRTILIENLVHNVLG